jgi:hypothetical protein
MKVLYIEEVAIRRWPRVMRWRSVRAQRSVDRGRVGGAIEPRNLIEVRGADVLGDPPRPAPCSRAHGRTTIAGGSLEADYCWWVSGSPSWPKVGHPSRRASRTILPATAGLHGRQLAAKCRVTPPSVRHVIRWRYRPRAGRATVRGKRNSLRRRA